MEKECWNCAKFKAYFTKGFWHFNREKNGKCIYNNSVVDKHNCCDNWGKNHLQRQIRKEVVLKGLIDTLKTLFEVNQIIIDENNENKVNSLPHSRKK